MLLAILSIAALDGIACRVAFTQCARHERLAVSTKLLADKLILLFGSLFLN